MNPAQTAAPRIPASRRRLLFIGLAGVLSIGAALAAYPALRVQHLVREMRACEHDAAAPRQALTAMLGDRAEPFFLRLLEDPEPGVRLQAAEEVLKKQGPLGLDRLAPLMGDYDARIRERLVEEASHWDTPEAYRLVLASTADGDVRVRQTAVTGLARRVLRSEDRSPETLHALARAVADTDPAIASAAMGAMRKVAGLDFGYRARATPEEQASAIARWQDWWKRRRPEPPPALPAPAAVTRSDSAPDFVVTDVDGRRWTLRALRDRSVVLHFFGTWCGSCVEEMKRLERLHRERPEVLVLSLGIAEDGPESLRRYAAQHRITFPLAMAPTPVAEAYGDVHEVPVTFLIDGEGRIRRRYDGPRDLETFAAALTEIARR